MIARGACVFLLLLAGAAEAGPPYFSDDPQPTDYRHYEIYLFSGGSAARGGSDGAFGIDFNYGAAPDLQITAVLPLAYESGGAWGIGNVELAAKYRFLHQAESEGAKTGWDVALFPRVFLPSPSAKVGAKHFSLLLPLWAERDFGEWSTFGGGGCAINRGGGAQDFCEAGWALTRQVTPALRLGAELTWQTADAKDGHAAMGLGAGAVYDLSETYHLMASAGPGLQNAAYTAETSWYAALLFTF
jgi:hypothetical protein